MTEASRFFNLMVTLLTTSHKKTASEVIVTNYDLGNYVFEENGEEIT